MNTRISWKINRTVFLVLLGLLFISHFPFINADPDRHNSVGRGPFTDEGLNTSQVRNWVNQGTLNLAECDNLLKTPLFGFPLVITYKIFGISLAVSRLHVLILVIMAMFLIGLDWKHRGIMAIFILTGLLKYQLFQYSQYSLAEMLSVASILLSIHFLARTFDLSFSDRKRNWQGVQSSIFLSLSYFIKIQFIYLIALLPLVLLIRWFTSNYFMRKLIIRQGFRITLTLLVLLLLYFFGWYFPNRETYDYMMAHQSGELSISANMFRHIGFNLGYHFLKGWQQWFFYFFILFVIAGFRIMKKGASQRYAVLFYSSVVWFLLEMHKLIMVYLPTRYQVSIFASMGLLMSVVAYEILSSSKIKMIPKALTTAALLFIFCINIYNYIDAYSHRNYVIRDTNEYIAQNLEKDDTALGAWAPAFTWDCKARAIPVWNNFLNYKDPIDTFHPKVIFSETDEQESEQAWKSQGINLRALADSTRTVKIDEWSVVVYWMK